MFVYYYHTSNVERAIEQLVAIIQPLQYHHIKMHHAPFAHIQLSYLLYSFDLLNIYPPRFLLLLLIQHLQVKIKVIQLSKNRHEMKHQNNNQFYFDIFHSSSSSWAVAGVALKTDYWVDSASYLVVEVEGKAEEVKSFEVEERTWDYLYG